MTNKVHETCVPLLSKETSKPILDVWYPTSKIQCCYYFILIWKKKGQEVSLWIYTKYLFCWFMSSYNLTKSNLLHKPRKQIYFTALHEDNTKKNTTFLIYRERWSIFSMVTTYQKHQELCLLVLVEHAAQFFGWHCLFTVPLERICLTLTRTEWVKQKQGTMNTKPSIVLTIFQLTLCLN